MKYLIKVCPYYDGRILHPVGSVIEFGDKKPPKGSLKVEESGAVAAPTSAPAEKHAGKDRPSDRKVI